MLPLGLGTSVGAQFAGGETLFLSISVGTQTAFLNGFTADRHDGINDCSGKTRAVKDASISSLDAISPDSYTTSPPNETVDNAVLHDDSPAMERTWSVTPRISHREGVFSQSGVHRYVPDRVGSTVRQSNSERVVDYVAMQAPHQLFGTVGNLFVVLTGYIIYSEQDRQWFLK